MPDTTNIEEALKRIRQMKMVVETLNSDLEKADDEWSKDRKNQFWARMTIRCMFALVEAILWNCRQVASEVATINGVELKDGDKRVISETRVKVDPATGEATEVQAFLKFEDSVKESMKVFAKAHKIPFTFDGNDPGFLALCRLNKKRGDLMHPKNIFSIGFNEEDFKSGQTAIRWTNGFLGALFQSANLDLTSHPEHKITS